MKNFKSNLIVFVVTVILMFLLMYKGCGTVDTVNQTQPKTPVSDFNLVKEESDTIRIHDSIIIFKPKPYRIIDSVYVLLNTPEQLDSLHKLCEYNRIYSDSFTDDNITIYKIDSVTGKINNSKLSYRLKVPVMITNTKYYTAYPKWSIFGGLETGISQTGTNLRIAPVIGLNVKEQSISYSFELFKQTHNIRYTKNLYTKYPKPPK